MNLTQALQPKTIDKYRGQKHILGENKPLYKMIKLQQIPHMFFYGPPGCGKTTLAQIIAKDSGRSFHILNGTQFKTEDLKNLQKRYENTLLKAVVFIDEIHRLSRNQQELLLPIMESTQILIIGASTENPYHSLTDAIRSRSFLFELKPLTNDDLILILDEIEILRNITISDQIKGYLINAANGDARSMINLVDFALHSSQELTIENLSLLRNQKQISGTNNQDTHYDLTSAMIKSIRGSDIDASLYYLARLLNGGEDVKFIARRLVILSSEDIGNANPNALNIATNTMLSVEKIGMPEARIILGQCVIYLASSPKSNSSYNAINQAITYATEHIHPIPEHLKNNSFPKTYKYPHDFGGFVEQEYANLNTIFYTTKNIGFEKNLQEWINKIKNINDKE